MLVLLFSTLHMWLLTHMVLDVITSERINAAWKALFLHLRNFSAIKAHANDIERRLDAVNELFSTLRKTDTLIFSTLSCQFISNVPTAILLSRFTGDYHALLLGVNIGGTGTLIASLASLITFNEYRTLYPGQTKKYLLLFSLINFIFLFIMAAAAKLFFV